MQTINPFELILTKIEQLQTTVNTLSENSKKSTKPQNESPDRLLDLPEAADIVRKPVGTVRYYIHHRNLPAIKVGKSYVVKLSALLLWVEEFSRKGGAETTSGNLMLANRKRYRKP
jgi:hypothetical protein